MKTFQKALTLEAIHAVTRGDLIRTSDVKIDNLADPSEAIACSIIFFENEKYLPLVKTTRAGLIITNAALRDTIADTCANLIIVENPYQAVLFLMHYWLEMEKEGFETLIHPMAVIGKNVILAEHVNIGAFVVIEEGAVIGDYSIIKPHCHIGKKASLGEHCLLYPNVTVYEDCILGNQVSIHSGTVVGADGFGYILMQGIQQKIPQVGNVIIHNNVEIGANTCIDRGTIGSTIIGEGTKIDNLVQIGHNCIIGKHSIVCAQVGLAGSTTIGDYVYLAGQVGAAGHLKVGDRTMVGAQAGISQDLAPDGKYFGTPARESQKMKRIMAVENNLPEMYKFFNQLKRDKGRE